MENTQITREEREEIVAKVFNMVGSGFGEEVCPSLKNDEKVKDYIDGKIDLKELSSYLINKGKTM